MVEENEEFFLIININPQHYSLSSLESSLNLSLILSHFLLCLTHSLLWRKVLFFSEASGYNGAKLVVKLGTDKSEVRNLTCVAYSIVIDLVTDSVER